MEAILLAGLKGVQEAFIENYLGPIFLILAGVLVVIAFRTGIRQVLLMALGALVAGVFIFNIDTLLGKDGTLTNLGEDLIETVAPNTVILGDLQPPE